MPSLHITKFIFPLWKYIGSWVYSPISLDDMGLYKIPHHSQLAWYTTTRYGIQDTCHTVRALVIKECDHASTFQTALKRSRKGYGYLPFRDRVRENTKAEIPWGLVMAARYTPFLICRSVYLRKRPITRLATKRISPTTKTTLAASAAVPATPPNPRKAAMMDMIRKITAQLNIIDASVYNRYRTVFHRYLYCSMVEETYIYHAS